VKKFFTAVILAVFILSAQIAAAADVDWNSAPRINSKAQLATYIENGRRRGQTEFNFVLTYTKINNEEELSRFYDELVNRIMIDVNIALHREEYGTGRVSFTITKEYPGTNVANAYRAHLNWDDRDFNNLEPEEKQLFHIAVGIVDEANKLNSEVEKARYIHDEICRRVEDFKEIDHATAINALVYRKTDCQGFADAFYMLGRMCGLNVVRINGTAKGKDGQWRGHGWNFITFSDGRSYCVDVTYGFNVKKLDLWTFQAMKPYYSCEWEIIPNLQ